MNIKPHWFRPAFLLSILLVLSGCFGITQPTDPSVKEMAEQKFNRDYAGLFTVEEVEKINGYKQNDTHYVAELKIHAIAQRSLDEYAKAIMHDESLSGLEKLTQSMSVGLLKMTLPEFQSGDRLEFDRDYLFIKTDNGWMLKKELEQSADN
ncbi:hypothetical protein [Thiomicrorhabdus heinhorstiae]|uniref:Lipoprotein n=1 Tax=Thiomicrorhabdus heinhorstiae TaxID=2748010 RepID=A0ABS0BXH1_9GAMM|nr:hypothetical protein [Thiomicrorhabdus heinhorstiae]MBF6058089.1 hypothetical protein [Thiomicrorhabdus heinhorstiae]